MYQNQRLGFQHFQKNYTVEIHEKNYYPNLTEES